MPAVRAAIAFIALLIAGSVHAAPFAVQVGETRIGLDAPPGFADTTFTGSPRLQELAEALTSPSNRILMFAISDGDLRRFTVGDRPEFRRYMVAVTSKELERERMGRQRFAEVAGLALRELGAPPSAEAALVEHLDRQPSGQPVLVRELRRDADVVSVLAATRVAPASRAQRTQYFLATNTLLLVRGKALSLSVHSAFDTAADLEWIRAITERWIDDVQRLNSH